MRNTKTKKRRLAKTEVRLKNGSAWWAERGCDWRGAANEALEWEQRNGRSPTARDLLMLAQDENSAWYTVVTHDPDKALEAYQLIQIRGLVRSLRLAQTYTDGHFVEVPLFTSVVTNTAEYESLKAAATSDPGPPPMGAISAHTYVSSVKLVRDPDATNRVLAEVLSNIQWLEGRLNEIRDYEDPELKAALHNARMRITNRLRAGQPAV